MKPRVVLISGAAATGKSTLAAALAPRLGAAVLDLDVATGPLTAVVSGLLGAADLSDPRLAALTREPRYETLYALAEENLRAGLSVVLVAPFTTERTTAGWAVVTRRLGRYAGDLTLVWLHLPPQDLVDRLTRRGAARDRDKMRRPEAFLATVHADPPAVPHLAVDAASPVPAVVESVLAHLA
jgi:predicted kinase